MSVHNLSENCPSCAEKLLGVDPRLVEWFTQRVKPMFKDCHISCGFRSKEEQDKAFRDGKSKAKFPYSPHNHMNGEKQGSRALDLFQLQNGVAVFDEMYFSAIWMQTEIDGLAWGGHFKTLRDYNHYQLKEGF
jgi:peptidoglycan L-alanyl-D-glutamate endopeptidase CwlK